VELEPTILPKSINLNSQKILQLPLILHLRRRLTLNHPDCTRARAEIEEIVYPHNSGGPVEVYTVVRMSLLKADLSSI